MNTCVAPLIKSCTGALLAAILTLGLSLTVAAQSLPDYKPAQKLTGTLRVSGNDQMAALMKRWERGFRQYHPELRFEEWLKGSGSGMYGLEMRTADIALMGRPINPYERYGVYERAWVYPVEIEVATGSFAVPHKSPAYAIFVHKNNPLAKLTLKQLDGIFGAERGGGWKALTWDERAAHTKDQNLRTWGQLGLKGEWADQPIHVYGPPNLGAGTITYFQTKVMGGGAIFNEDLREYADRRQMIADLAQDPYGIAYTALGYRSPGVKPVALAQADAGPFVALTRASVADRSYPLARPVYIYYTIDNEKTEIANPRVDPKVREFLRYVLSRQGQQAVAQEGIYLPLPAAVASEQRTKLDFAGVPPERKLLKDED
jgi:phosphate transport system substrate-binding protein